MNIFYKSIEYLASFLEIYILYEVFESVLSKYRRSINRNVIYPFSCIGTLIIQTCNHVTLFSYFTIIIFVVYSCLTASIMYKTSIILLFSIASFYALCVSCFDFVAVTLVSTIWNEQHDITNLLYSESLQRIFLIVLVKMIWVLAFIIFKKCVSKLNIKVNHSYALLWISVIGFLGFVFLVEQTCKNFEYSLTGVWLILVILLVFCLFVAYYVIANKEERMKLNFEKLRNNLLEENYNVIRESYINNAKLYHDMNNHFNVIYQLIGEGKNEVAQSYIREIGMPIIELSKTVWTGNDVVDVIINSKIEKMIARNIEYEINVEFPDNTNISQHDMCSILGNLLDNAIEATEKLAQDRKFSLTIRRINQFIMVKAENTCLDTFKTFSVFPETTKEERELHGWGLPSVMDAVEKYNGTMKCSCEGGVFTVVVLLFFDSAPMVDEFTTDS